MAARTPRAGFLLPSRAARGFQDRKRCLLHHIMNTGRRLATARGKYEHYWVVGMSMDFPHSVTVAGGLSRLAQIHRHLQKRCWKDYNYLDRHAGLDLAGIPCTAWQTFTELTRVSGQEVAATKTSRSYSPRRTCPESSAHPRTCTESGVGLLRFSCIPQTPYSRRIIFKSIWACKKTCTCASV